MEKSNRPEQQPTEVNEALEAEDGYILDINQYGDRRSDVKTAPDGRSVLIPQPSSDKSDPLNWPSRKKHIVLAVVAFVGFLPDFGSSIGVITLLQQSAEWDLSQVIVQRNVVGTLFAQGGGSLIAVWLSYYFGRLPVLFWFQTISVGMAIWCAVATSFESFLAARILCSLFDVTAQGGGLMFIKDMFFYHEHPRKINLWSGAFILSPYLGPFFSAFICAATSWRWCFWLFTILEVIGWFLIVFFADETFYNRTLAVDQQPQRKSRLLRLLGIEQWKQKFISMTLLESAQRTVMCMLKIPISLIVVYYFLVFAWIIGVNATITVWLTANYSFTPNGVGLFYFCFIAGTFIGELSGHWLHDLFGRLYMTRHNGRIEPEARLTIIYPATALMTISLIILGFALQHLWHYMVLAIFAAGQVVGIQIATTAVNAYLLDAYPEASGEIAAWLNVGRSWGGFMSVYIQINWVEAAGAEVVLGIQAAVTAAAVLFMVVLQVYGKRIRKAQGRIRFGSGGKA